MARRKAEGTRGSKEKAPSFLSAGSRCAESLVQQWPFYQSAPVATLLNAGINNKFSRKVPPLAEVPHPRITRPSLPLDPLAVSRRLRRGGMNLK